MNLKIKNYFDNLADKLYDSKCKSFIFLLLVCGLITTVLLAVAWTSFSGGGIYGLLLSLFGAGQICLLSWGIGGMIAWVILPLTQWKWLWILTYFISIVIFGLLPGLFGLYSDSNVGAWMVIFLIGFAIMSLPSTIFMYFRIKKLFSAEKENNET